MEPNEDEYIMLFKAYRVSGLKSQQSSKREQEEVNEINVYPNPTRGRFSIDSKIAFDGKVSVFVTDVLGRTVLSRENVSPDQMEFDISDENPGMYLIRVVSKDNEWIQSIVLQ